MNSLSLLLVSRPSSGYLLRYSERARLNKADGARCIRVSKAC